MGAFRIAIATALVAVGIGVAADHAAAAASKPDATIRLQGGPLVGNDQYADDGFQQVTGETPGPETFVVRVGNDGTEVDSFRLFASMLYQPAAKASFEFGGAKVKFTVGGQDVTEKIAAGRLKFRNVPPGGSSPKLHMIVRADGGDTGGGVVFASSLNNPNREDGVGAMLRPDVPF